MCPVAFTLLMAQKAGAMLLTHRRAAVAAIVVVAALVCGARADPPQAPLCFSDSQCFPTPMLDIVSTPEQRDSAIAETIARLKPYFNLTQAVEYLDSLKATHPVLDVDANTMLDFVAISGYTASTQGLNSALRESPANASILNNTIAVCSGLKRLRDYAGSDQPVLTYRGVSLPPAAFAQWRKDGAYIQNRAFFSTTVSLETARMFATLDKSAKYWKQPNERVVMVGSICTGAEISYLGYYDWSRSQSEHLVAPGTTINVLRYVPQRECFTNGTWAQNYTALFYVEQTANTPCATMDRSAALASMVRSYAAAYEAMPAALPRVSYCKAGDKGGKGDEYPSHEL